VLGQADAVAMSTVSVHFGVIGNPCARCDLHDAMLGRAGAVIMSK
jgi:hypothetical protein